MYQPNRKTECEQADDLLKQYMEESVLENKLTDHFTVDIEKRLQLLKEFNRSYFTEKQKEPSSSPKIITVGTPDELTNAVDSLTVMKLSESESSDMDEIDSDFDSNSSQSIEDKSDDSDDQMKDLNEEQTNEKQVKNNSTVKSKSKNKFFKFNF